MAKIKTIKATTAFNDAILAILKLHQIEVPENQVQPFLDTMKVYVNECYKPDNKTMWWNQLVTQYFNFYEELINVRPAFLGQEAKALKGISKILQERYLHKNPTGLWDEQTALTQHLVFYNTVITLPFIRQNFAISFLYSNFDKIISQLAHQSNRQKEIDEKILAK